MNGKKTAVGFCLLVLMTSCSVSNPFDKRKVSEPVQVRTMLVEMVENTSTRSYVGTASASKSTRITSRYPGTLVSLNVEKGDYVQEGEIIAEISSQSVLSASEIAYATLRQAEDGYKRVKQLHETGSIPDVKMVEMETQLAKARAAARAADKSMEECKVKAPFSGVIGDVMVDEGIELNLMDEIVRILDISSVEINFPVPENELGKVETGASASISIPALGLEGIPARISSKGIVASPLSHTYECSLKTLEKIPGLMPGMVCKVYWGYSNGDGVVVPSSVVRTDERGRYVWTVKDGIVHKEYVVPGGFSGKGVIILAGLSGGDEVITEGVQKVCTGMEVRVLR